jgi:polar amino acid transport system substrate-binding protein
MAGRMHFTNKTFFIVTLFMFLVSFIVLAGCGKSTATPGEGSGTLGKIIETGKIVVGTSADYPPYEFRLLNDEEGDIVGIDIDIANEIARELGVKLEVKDILFSKLFDSLNAGEIDMIIAGIAPTEKRKEVADFSDVYYQAIQEMLIRADETRTIKSIEDLRGKKVGVQKDSIQEESARNQIKGAEFILEEKVTELVAALKQGDIDALILEKPVADSFALRNSDLISIAAGVDDQRMGSAIAVRKGNDELLQKINEVLRKLKDGNKIAEFIWEAKILSNK